MNRTAGDSGQDSGSPDILCLGEPMVEFNEQPDGHFVAGCGGDTSNCAVAAARQGARVGYICRIGRDGFGRQLAELWQAEGVTNLSVVDAAAPTGIYFVRHSARGHAFEYRRAGSAASLLTPADLPVETIRRTRILHVSGISQAISQSAADAVFAAIDIARAAGVTISYDTNLRLQLWPLTRARAIIHAAMATCDIARPSLDDARLLTGLDVPEAIADFYLSLGAKIVALTLGSEGVLLATGESTWRLPALSVQTVDATGAGDTFSGAFLAEYLRSGDPVGAATYANTAAALSTTRYGAVAAMPARDEVEAYATRAAGGA